jgi:hypothetical protein
MTDQQILEVVQQERQIKQKYEDRQLAKQANSDDHLDGLRPLFGKGSSETNHKKFDDETKQLTSDEKISAVRAVAEEASKTADRVMQALANRRLLSEQKSIAEAPQGNSAEAPQRSAEAPTNSFQSEQKNIPGPCLFSGTKPPEYPITSVSCTPIENALQLSAQYNTINTCSDVISDVQFQDTLYYTCPKGCTEPSETNLLYTPGNPSSIGYRGISSASSVTNVVCETSNGDQVAPTALTVTVQPVGIRNGGETLGSVNVFTCSPS